MATSVLFSTSVSHAMAAAAAAAQTNDVLADLLGEEENSLDLDLLGNEERELGLSGSENSRESMDTSMAASNDSTSSEVRRIMTGLRQLQDQLDVMPDEDSRDALPMINKQQDTPMKDGANVSNTTSPTSSADNSPCRKRTAAEFQTQSQTNETSSSPDGPAHDEALVSVVADRVCADLNEHNRVFVGEMIRTVGPTVGLRLLKETRDIEASGGMMTNDNARRRQPGGVFFQLVRNAIGNSAYSKLATADARRRKKGGQQQQKNKRRSKTGGNEDSKAAKRRRCGNGAANKNKYNAPQVNNNKRVLATRR